MRQYCSPRMWSSTQPLPGACRSGWFKNNRKVPPGAQHPAHLGEGVGRAFDVLEHQAGERGVEAAVGERQSGRGRPGVLTPQGRLPRLGRPSRPARRLFRLAVPGARARWRCSAASSCGHVGSTPTTRRTPGKPAATRESWPSPQPMSSTLAGAASDRSSRSSGIICSVYSGSAPSVKLPATRPS